MTATYRVIDKSDYAESFDETENFGLDILVGLSEPRKVISSKYLYDKRGSELFRAITKLPEYYPTNCEIEILERCKDEIANLVANEPINLVELGAGFGSKTRILLEHFLSRGLDFRFVPIDISESAMNEFTKACSREFPTLEVQGIVSDYFSGLYWLNNRYQRRNLVLFLGSSIGNFTGSQARVFLRNLWSCMNDEDLTLIGFDLKKDIELLLRAYNDSQGVTAQFNLNVLERINRELGGEFDINKFRHFGTYDVFSGGMESYLVSLEQQEVYVAKIARSFTFAPWEPIHVEYSYKYLVEDIEKVAEDTGFQVEKHLFENRHFFTDSIWRVAKPGNDH